VIAGVIGAALGSGWILLTGEMVARSYGVPVAAGLAMHHLFREGLAIPTAGVILMLVPTIVVRLLRPKSREALDGFVIGALGALTFTGAATLTRLAPQFATGLLAHSRPVTGLLVEAGMGGVTIPLTAVVACGLFGMALWFNGQTNNPREHPGRVRAMLLLFAGLVLLIHVGVGATGIIGLPQLLMLGIQLVMALIALLVLRVGLQLALLHEEHDPIQEHEPLLCVHCAHVVPDMAFCPACGVATRASSRSSRKERRESRPVRLIAAEGS
jgi:hypothetical protein